MDTVLILLFDVFLIPLAKEWDSSLAIRLYYMHEVTVLAIKKATSRKRCPIFQRFLMVVKNVVFVV
jgi:hypothetical protein